MGILKRGILAAILAGVMGTATAAWACDVQGKVVCASTGAGVANVKVTLNVGWGDPFVAYTDGNGDFSMHVWYVNTTYTVTLDLTNAGVTGDASLVIEPSVTCNANADPIAGLAYGVTVPGCDASADCSQGFYKNHPETWCDYCFAGVGCTSLVEQLSTRGAESAAIRDAAKAQIDACFGTAEASPCTDDNY